MNYNKIISTLFVKKMLSIVSKVCHYYFLHCNSNYIRQLKKVVKYTYVKKVAVQVKMKTIAKLAISVQQAWSNTTKIFLQSYELFFELKLFTALCYLVSESYNQTSTKTQLKTFFASQNSWKHKQTYNLLQHGQTRTIRIFDF